MEPTATALTSLFLVALTFAGNLLQACAQDSRPPSLVAGASSSGGGASVEDEPSVAADLAMKLANPVAALISVPIQNNCDWGAGGMLRLELELLDRSSKRFFADAEDRAMAAVVQGVGGTKALNDGPKQSQPLPGTIRTN